MDGEEERTAVDKLSSSEELYFTKDGRLKPGKAPSAFAWTNPWPPCPTNLNKNKVFRPTEEQNQEVFEKAKEEYEKEAKPLSIPEEINTLSRMPVPDIELALYWDRHPYEFRHEAHKQRSKSAMNLSSVGDLINLKSNSPSTGSRKSSADSGNSKKSRSSSASPQIRRNSNVSSVSTVRTSDNKEEKVDNQLEQSLNETKNGNPESNNHKSSSRAGTDSPKGRTHGAAKPQENSHLPKILQVLSINEKRKLEDIKRPAQSAHGKNSVRHEDIRRPYTVRDVKSNPNNAGNSIGVQASLDEISSAALMSTYLCPLHGQYHRGVERRSKNGFRTDMSSTTNPHARCSRSRTRLVKDTEIQTDDTSYLSGSKKGSSKGRSKTAGPRSHARSNNNMLSEYNGNYKHPAKIADMENRRLRNKILSYCFTKQSIF